MNELVNNSCSSLLVTEGELNMGLKGPLGGF